MNCSPLVPSGKWTQASGHIEGDLRSWDSECGAAPVSQRCPAVWGTLSYSVLNPRAVKRHCVERSPQLELLMSRAGEAAA